MKPKLVIRLASVGFALLGLLLTACSSSETFVPESMSDPDAVISLPSAEAAAVACETFPDPEQCMDDYTALLDSVNTTTTTTFAIPETTTTTVVLVESQPYPWDLEPDVTYVYLGGDGIPMGMTQQEYNERTANGEEFRSMSSAPDWYLEAWAFRDSWVESYVTAYGVEPNAILDGVSHIRLAREVVDVAVATFAADRSCEAINYFWELSLDHDPEMLDFALFALSEFTDDEDVAEIAKESALCGWNGIERVG